MGFIDKLFYDSEIETRSTTSSDYIEIETLFLSLFLLFFKLPLPFSSLLLLVLPFTLSSSAYFTTLFFLTLSFRDLSRFYTFSSDYISYL